MTVALNIEQMPNKGHYECKTLMDVEIWYIPISSFSIFSAPVF